MGALVGNGLNISVSIGVNIVFGSVSAILALLLWGRWWGCWIGIIAALLTWVSWGHPWAAVTFAIEIIWLSLLTHRAENPTKGKPTADTSNADIIIHDIVFWVFIGVPLTFLFYSLIIQLNPTSTLLVAIKQGLNGVFNTLLAFLIFLGIRVSSRHGKQSGVSVRGAIVSFGLFAIITPALITTIVSAGQLNALSQSGVAKILSNVAHDSERVADADITRSGSPFWVALSGIAIERQRANGSAISSDTKLFHRLNEMYQDGGRNFVTQKGLKILLPRSKGPIIKQWVNGYWEYQRSSSSTAPGANRWPPPPLAITMTRVVQPARQQVLDLQKETTRSLEILAVVVLLGILISELLARMFEREVQKVLQPLLTEPEFGSEASARSVMPTLALTAIRELHTMIDLINERIRRVNQLTRELAQSRDQMAQLSITDALTGCRNRRDFYHRLDEEIARSRRHGQTLSGLMIDIDFFKNVNDVHGHPVGDEVLIAVAKSLRSSIRFTDYCCRYGGEEFVVLLVNCSDQEARNVADVMRKKVSNLKVYANRQTLTITVSIGVTAFRFPEETPETFLSRMDGALYRAKHSGRNIVVVD